LRGGKRNIGRGVESREGQDISVKEKKKGTERALNFLSNARSRRGAAKRSPDLYEGRGRNPHEGPKEGRARGKGMRMRPS